MSFLVGLMILLPVGIAVKARFWPDRCVSHSVGDCGGEYADLAAVALFILVEGVLAVLASVVSATACIVSARRTRRAAASNP